MWRPLWETVVRERRLCYAVFTMRGAVDVLTTAWLAGVPLVVTAWLAPGELRRMALAFTVPSLVFVVFFWPVQGLAVESDLVLAAFPAIFAALWCAANSRTSSVAAWMMLVSGHVVWWRVVFERFFVNARVT